MKVEFTLTLQLVNFMKNTYKLIWSNEALINLKGIIDYLENKWAERQIKKFAQLLDKQLKLIEGNPYLISQSEKSEGLRKAALSSQTKIYYRIIENEVRIITLFDNRQNLNKLIDK